MLFRSPESLSPVSEFVDQWRPLTSSFALVKAPLKTAVDRFATWHSTTARFPGQTGLRQEIINTPFPSALRTLEPFNRGDWRHLFVPTDSDWTLVVNSNLPAPDLSSLAYVFADDYGLTTLVVRDQPHTLDTRTDKGRYGIFEFALYSPSGTGPSRIERMVRLLRELSAWEFLEIGEPLPFEHVERYKARRKTDRLDEALIIEYLGHMGAWPFNEKFYDVAEKPILVTKLHPNNDRPPLLTLEDLRAGAEDD